MSIARAIKRRARTAVPPVIFLLLIAYFLWSAVQGERGLRASAQRQQELAAAQAELSRAEADLQGWERRVASLHSNRLDRDALDERARAMLNLSDPGDIIIPYGSGQRLF
jgi:cell division protein FtsB